LSKLTHAALLPAELAKLGSWEQPQPPVYIHQYVPLVVWQITVYKYNLALAEAYGTENCNQ
jgi:hypothetical protein